MLAFGQLAHLDGVAFHPLAVRVLGCEVLLDFLVGDDAAFLGIDQEHLAWLKAALGHDMLIRDLRQHAGLGGKHDISVVGKLPATGTEAVAIQQRSNLSAIGEHDVRRAVPWLDQCVVVLVERLDIGIELTVLLPCRRKHHAYGVGQGSAGKMQQFEAFVEGAGVGIPRGGDRQQRFEFAQQFAAQTPLAGGQPVAVALDGVDLAIMRQQTERLRQRPARERVGGEAGMHDGHLGLHAFVGQIQEEGLELHGGEHALVCDGAGG